MKRKVVKKSILYGMIATMLLLGLSVGGFAREYIEDPPPADMYPEKQMAFDWLDQPAVREKYGAMANTIWSYAELGMQEFKSSKLVADELEKAGFKVERGAAGMPTAFVASYGSGKPVLGILVEYDALPMISQKGKVPYQDPLVETGPGHGCVHNAQGPAGVSAAIAIKAAMDRYGLRGTIRIYGSPAEETLVSRPYMVIAGLFDGVDAVLKTHGGTSFGGGQIGGIRSNAMFSTEYTFRGVTAHSAGGPWNAKSALDGVELMNDGANLLREHLYFTYRMHYVIPAGGQAPNVVPDYAKVWYFIRNTDERLLSMVEKVNNCAKGAALATGTELSIRVLTAIHQKHESGTLAILAHRNSMLVGMPEWTDEDIAFGTALQKERGRSGSGFPTKLARLYYPGADDVFTGGGSADSADVSWVTALFGTTIPVNSSTGHHWTKVATAYDIGKSITANAKVMAGIMIDLLTKPKELKEIRDEFEGMYEKYGYESYLPDDATPPNDLNAELMMRYRPLTEPTYIEWPY